MVLPDSNKNKLGCWNFHNKVKCHFLKKKSKSIIILNLIMCDLKLINKKYLGNKTFLSAVIFRYERGFSILGRYKNGANVCTN